MKNHLREVWASDTEAKDVVRGGEYLYGIDGFRIWKIDREGERTLFVFDLSGKILEEVNLSSGDRISSVFLKQRPLARVSAEGTLFYGLDHLGSTVLMMNEAGEVVWEGDMNSFGDMTAVDSELDLGLKYTGKDLDEDTGLYYFNARWYDVETGRFITGDSIRDGQNWCTYCSNNPINRKELRGTGLHPSSNRIMIL